MKLKSHLPSLAIGFLCLYFLLRDGFSSFWLDPYDEALYLLHSLSHAWIPGWGPLYAVYYRFLGFFYQDPILIYNLNFVLLAIGVFLSVYVLVFSLTQSRLISLGTGLFSLATEASLQIYPKIHVFNYCVLFLLFFGLHRNTKNMTRLLCFYVLLAMSLYIRQDNLIYLIVVLLYDLKRWGSVKAAAKILAVTLLSLIALRWAWGTPFEPARTWSAFSDHYSWTIPSYQKDIQGQEPNLETVDRVSKIFANAKSLPQAFLQKPVLFLTAIFYHALHFPDALLQAMNPDPNDQATNYLIGFSFWLTLLAALWLCGEKPSLPIRPQLRNLLSLFLLAATLRALMTNCLLSPQPKYMVDLALLLPAAAIIFILRKVPSPPWHFDQRKQYALFALFVFGLHFLGSEQFRYPIKDGEREINSALIDTIIQYKSKVLSGPPAQETYLYNYITVVNVRDYTRESPNEGIGHFLIRHNVDIFYVNDNFLSWRKQSAEFKYYEQFFADPKTWHFRPISIGVPGTHAFVRMRGE